MVNSTQTSGPLQALSGYVASYGWGPLLSVSRSTVLSLLSRIQIGHLRVADVDGTASTYGRKEAVNGSSEKSVYSLPNVELTVHKDIFWVRMLLFADMVIMRRLQVNWNAWTDLNVRVSQRATCLERSLAPT